jgi:glutathione peroxidase
VGSCCDSLDNKVIGLPCAQFEDQEIPENEEIPNVLKFVRPGGGFEPNFSLTERTLESGIAQTEIFAFEYFFNVV